MTRTQRWTLAVVCAATAMLMLDIAVVNTALSRSPTTSTPASRACSGSSTPTPSRWRRSSSPPARSPTASAAAACSRIGLGVFTAASLRARRRPSITMLNVARAVQGVGAAIMFAVSLALLANAFPRIEERAGALAAYGATIGALVRGRPARRRRAHLRPGLAVDLPHQPPARARCACRSCARYVAESSDPRAPRVDRARARHADRRPLPARASRCCAATRTAGRSAPIVASLAGAAVLLCAFVAVEARVAQPDAPAAALPQPVVHGRAGRGVRDLRVAVRDVPLHDAVPAADPRAVGDRGRPRLPARDDPQLLSSRAPRRPGRPEGLTARADRGRPGAGRRRPGAADDRRGGLVVVAVPARPARRDARHRDVQPGGQPGRARARRRRSRAASPPA